MPPLEWMAVVESSKEIQAMKMASREKKTKAENQN